MPQITKKKKKKKTWYQDPGKQYNPPPNNYNPPSQQEWGSGSKDNSPREHQGYQAPGYKEPYRENVQYRDREGGQYKEPYREAQGREMGMYRDPPHREPPPYREAAGNQPPSYRDALHRENPPYRDPPQYRKDSLPLRKLTQTPVEKVRTRFFFS